MCKVNKSDVDVQAMTMVLSCEQGKDVTFMIQGRRLKPTYCRAANCTLTLGLMD
jgi:hypothetical protein